MSTDRMTCILIIIFANKYIDDINSIRIILFYSRDDNEIMLNEQVGHILRTKASNEDEGGIVAGIGALDSPYLIS